MNSNFSLTKRKKSAETSHLNEYQGDAVKSLTNKIQDALICSRAGECQDEHGKFRHSDDKLRLLLNHRNSIESQTEFKPSTVDKGLAIEFDHKELADTTMKNVDCCQKQTLMQKEVSAHVSYATAGRIIEIDQIETSLLEQVSSNPHTAAEKCCYLVAKISATHQDGPKLKTDNPSDVKTECRYVQDYELRLHDVDSLISSDYTHQAHETTHRCVDVDSLISSDYTHQAHETTHRCVDVKPELPVIKCDEDFSVEQHVAAALKRGICHAEGEAQVVDPFHNNHFRLDLYKPDFADVTSKMCDTALYDKNSHAIMEATELSHLQKRTTSSESDKEVDNWNKSPFLLDSQLIYEKERYTRFRSNISKWNRVKYNKKQVITEKLKRISLGNIHRERRAAKPRTRTTTSQGINIKCGNRYVVDMETRQRGPPRYYPRSSSHKVCAKQTECFSLQSSKINIVSQHSSSSEDRIKFCCNALTYTENCQLFCQRQNEVYSGLQRNAKSSKCEVQIGVSANSNDTYSNKATVKLHKIRPSFNSRLRNKQRYGGRRRRSKGNKSSPECLYCFSQAKLLPSYFLNVNTNAGISETCPEGLKAETKQLSSCTSVHSSDQYFSTHTDTPDGKIMDSDMEVSPSFSFTEEGAEKVAAGVHIDSEPGVSKSWDQVRQLSDDSEDKNKNVMQTCNDGNKQKRQSINSDEVIGDECVEMRSDRHLCANQAVLVTAQEDHAANKHKRKTKTTETLYIKFESSMSKKVTTTTVLKDGRKPIINKSRPEGPKQLPSVDDQKAITGAPEKMDSKTLIETPRHTKIIRCAEGHHENSENQTSRSATADETSLSKTQQNHAVRAVESDHHLNQSKVLTAHYGKEEYQGNNKRVHQSERSMTHKSPIKSLSPPDYFEGKPDYIDSDYASEKESSAATIVHVPNVSPVKEVPSAKEAKEQSVKNEMTIKVDKQTKVGSPKRESRKPHEKKAQPKPTTPAQVECCNKKVEPSEELQSKTEAVSPTRSESPKSENSALTDVISRKKSLIRQKGVSPQKKSPSVEGLKREHKKVISVKVRSKTADDIATKEDVSEPPKGKTVQQPAIAAKKRSPARTKTQSRSPESKRRKRSVKKSADSKSSNSVENAKPEKVKKQKVSDKVIDKKKKKKKQKQKVPGRAENDSSDSLLPTKKVVHTTRSRSTESTKTTQTLTCSVSAPQFVEATALPNQMSSITHWTDDDKLSFGGDKQSGGMDAHSLDRDIATKSREMKVKSRAASSAENVSLTAGTVKPVRAAESVPTFTGTVYTSLTKVVQVASCHKIKKTEKDLQQAELGWNSSTLSAEERAAAEKAKQIQKRAKARYYFIKPRPRKMDGEIGRLKFKRAAARRCQVEGDSSAREMSDKGDLAQQEKARPGQGKSVQFSDSTEDHEASKDDTESSKATLADEKTISQDVSAGDETAQESANQSTSEAIKPFNKADVDGQPVSSKPAVQKRDDLRSQITPPRKKRPIWLKKPAKEKPATNVKASAAVKSVPALVPIKQRQSSENILKPSSRIVQLNCPGKEKMHSPSLSNMSLDDNRTVAYNTWINSTILAAPMNKATKKLVAKKGSPVDIREIIEGSSVDGAEYYRSVRSLHELGLRAAKSVPALGPQRIAGTDVVGSKRCKLPGESRLTSHRKYRDIKAHESGSARSLSSAEGADDHGVSVKNRLGRVESSVSLASSTDVDAAGFTYSGRNRLLDQGHPRKKKKQNKSSNDDASKWHLVDSQDVHSVPDLTHTQYYGDTMELNALNMGLTWMVQSVFSRLPFLNQRQPSTANPYGDMPSTHHVGE